MKRSIIGLLAIFVGCLAFGNVASADTISVDTSDVPSVKNFVIDDDYTDTNSFTLSLDDQKYCLVDDKLVPSFENFRLLNTSAPRSEIFAYLKTGESRHLSVYPTSGYVVIIGSEPTSGGIATRRQFVEFTNPEGSIRETAFDLTVTTGRWDLSYRTKLGATRLDMTNLSEPQEYKLWYVPYYDL